jgi:hypothetical protein
MLLDEDAIAAISPMQIPAVSPANGGTMMKRIPEMISAKKKPMYDNTSPPFLSESKNKPAGKSGIETATSGEIRARPIPCICESIPLTNSPMETNENAISAIAIPFRMSLSFLLPRPTV